MTSSHPEPPGSGRVVVEWECDPCKGECPCACPSSSRPVRFGDAFLSETLWFHLSRTDVRHNFSLWFLPQYLAAGRPHLLQAVKLAATAVQVLLHVPWMHATHMLVLFHENKQSLPHVVCVCGCGCGWV